MRRKLITATVVLSMFATALQAQNAEDAPAAFGFGENEWEDVSGNPACAGYSQQETSCADNLFGGCVEDECRKAIDFLYDGAPTKDRFEDAEKQCLIQDDPCKDNLEALERLVTHRQSKLAGLSCQTVDVLAEAFSWSPLFANAECRSRAAQGFSILAAQRCQVERKREECDKRGPEPALRCALTDPEIDILRARKRALCAYNLPTQDSLVRARLAVCNTDAAGESEAQCLAPNLIEARVGKGCHILATVDLPDILLEEQSPSEASVGLTVAYPNQVSGDDACLFGLGLIGGKCSVGRDALRVSGRTLFERGDSDLPTTITAYFGLGETAPNELLRVRFTPADMQGEAERVPTAGLFSPASNQCSLDSLPRATGHAYALRRNLVGNITEATFDNPPHIEGSLLSDCARVSGRYTLCWSQSLWEPRPPHFLNLRANGQPGTHERFVTWRPDAFGEGGALSAEDLAQAQDLAGASPFYRLAESGGRTALWLAEVRNGSFRVLSSTGADGRTTAIETAWLDAWLMLPPESAAARFDWWLTRWPLRPSSPPTGAAPEPRICWAEGQLGDESLICGEYGVDSRPTNPFADGFNVAEIAGRIGDPSASGFFSTLARLPIQTSVTWVSTEHDFDDRALLTQPRTAAVGLWHDTKGRRVETRLRGELASAETRLRDPSAFSLAAKEPDAQRWVFGAGAERIMVLDGTSDAYATTPAEAELSVIIANLGDCTLARQSAKAPDTGWIDIAELLARTEAEDWFATTTSVTAEERLEAAIACFAGERTGPEKCGTKNLRALLSEAANNATEIDAEGECGQ